MSEERKEQRVDFQRVWDEHLGEVNEPAHWVYLFVVLIGSTLLMVLLIAAMAGAAS